MIYSIYYIIILESSKLNYMKKVILKKLIFGLASVVAVSTSFGQNLQISGGNNFSAAVCDNQTVFVWGANTSSQLAIDATDAPVGATYRNAPGAVSRGNVNNTATGTTYGDLPAIRQVDAGSGAHLLGLSCSGQVWGWGENGNGQLGRNTVATSPIPKRVLRGAQASFVDAIIDPNGIFLNNIFYVSGGNNSSYALESTTGRVLAWGQNANGQLGNGTTIDSPIPVYVLRSAAEGGGQLTNIVQIEGGDDCTYALDANGNVWSWGNNNGNKLGRPGAGIQSTAGRVVQGDPMNNGYSTTPTPTVYLNGIIQISGGDTHCLALDKNGNVWSFGGDWGEGQLGRAGGSVYQDDARKVAIPGITTYATTNAQFLGNGVDGKAIFVSAGQANSAVVMANGKVVTFGSRGLFNSGATVTAATTITCPVPDGDMIPSGSLGDGNATACNSTSCNGKATQFSRTPVYVTTSSGAHLTGIASVSDGDAWFYAVSSTGSAYAWGWNRRGELGLGDYVDRCYAVPFTLPSGCSLSNPCPGKPNLGSDVITCPVFSTILNSNVPQTYTTYKYTWEYRSGTTGPWTPLGTPLGNNPTYSFADVLGQYRVTISDSRSSVPFLCAPCPIYIDTITFSPQPNPYTVDGCSGPVNSTYTVTDPAGTAIKWYTTPTGGTPLNPSDVLNSITVPNATAPITAACGAGKRALFAEDVTSFSGILRPGTTVASAPCAGAGSTEQGSRSPLEIEVSQNLNLTSVSFIQPNKSYAYSATYSVKIYSNDPANGYNCSGCTPANSKLGQPGTLLYTSTGTTLGGAANLGDQVRTLVTNYTLTGTAASPVKYWIIIDGGELQYFNCSPAVTQTGVPVPIWTAPQVSTPAGMRALIATHDNSPTGNSHLFNLTFDVGSGYACGRILVCQSTTTCTLPVELLYFSATKSGEQAVLNWATATEINSNYFYVQKSTDGINWTTIGKVNAAGNSTSILEYSFTDPNLLSVGTNYYRIVEVDFDGSSYNSNIERIKVSDENLNISVVPNPNNGNFNVTIHGGDKNTLVTLSNTLGQVVYQRAEEITNTYSQDLNLGYLSKGVYYLSVKNLREYKTVRIILE